jgi:mono/diheme cytochrome c family protein
MKHMAAVRWRLAPGVLLAGLVSCKAPGGPGSEPVVSPSSIDGGAEEVSVGTQALCLPAAAEALPGRIIAGSGEQAGTTTVEREVFVTDLFARFRNACGGCHVENTTGNFHTDRPNFTKLELAAVEAAIENDDPTKFMPPPPIGKAWRDRDQSDGSVDPIVLLVRELAQWAAQGKPDDVYRVKTEQTMAADSYAVPEEMAQRQTNVGNCIPQRGMVGTQKQDMDELDAKFAAMTSFAELPKTLAETDLSTLDSATLARRGVVSFAPGYPLWSEDSGKMRMVRVPNGKSIKFNKETQLFEIPENTRFYKTFLKKITQADGKEVWRKIETRLIVARGDTQKGDQPVEPQALFATYAWNEEETEARLVEDALRSGEPFADRLFTYVVDQPRYDKLVEKLTAQKGKGIEGELAKEENKGIVRHYLIPGKRRCVECHMGSPMADFVLGFTPVQIRRRPKGEAGAYEESGPDELSQLQRLIDYGVITGVTSPSDIRGLEMPQGPPGSQRSYRNKHELLAQAYLLGNCAHCHNPRGFPSVKSPELIEVLDFFPSQREHGGIFQFPLERVSPLRRRGANQDLEIPYITPSLRDYPAGTAGDVASADRLGGLWTLKWVDCLRGFGLNYCDVFNDDDVDFIAAPWRSLIYRNVDTPYIYTDDFTVFPHMPRHSVGFDCRAPRIMGDWMVSIPAIHKKEGAADEDNVRDPPFDTNAQPYTEVKSGDPAYMVGLAGAAERLYQYHRGRRYDYCPDRRDIVIPEALVSTDPTKLVPPDVIQYADAARKKVVMPNDGVPDRAHVVPSDTTDVPGDWLPRRGDFTDTDPDPTRHNGVLTNPRPSPQPDQISIPWVLRDFHVSRELCELAIEKEIPFGVWKKKEGCDLSSAPHSDAFTGADRLNWIDHWGKPAADAPIYTITPGAAVFNNICVNCHGPQADSKGLLSEAISEMTGGAARVANLRDGLLGPPGKPGGNIGRVFDADKLDALANDRGTTDLDWAARYLSWMALGGTQRVLPGSLLKIVGATRVMGLPRSRPGQVVAGTPNMLELARNACNNVLVWTSGTPFTKYFNDGHPDWTSNTLLLGTIGDAEMWQRVCSIGNRPVVRVPVWDAGSKSWLLTHSSSFYWGESYGEHPVMNHRGGIDQRIEKDNLMPTCVAAADLAPQGNDPAPAPPMTPDGRPIPTCPASLLEETTVDGLLVRKNALGYVDNGSGSKSFVGADEWAARGAANAGTAVLLYLSQVRDGVITPKPAFDHCEQLDAKTLKLPRAGVCAGLLGR